MPHAGPVRANQVWKLHKPCRCPLGQNLQKGRLICVPQQLPKRIQDRLGLETRPAEGLFQGWVEEVDSCIQRRFRSTEELLAFLGQRFDAAAEGGLKSEAVDPPRTKKKASVRKKS